MRFVTEIKWFSQRLHDDADASHLRRTCWEGLLLIY